jgi:kynurenine formamidase
VEDIKALGRRLSNWGRWGANDRLGTLNHITPERLVAAARLVRTGKLFDLGLPLGSDGIQIGLLNRINPVHTMTMTPHDFHAHGHNLRPEGMIFSDDYIYMPLQCATQWDGLGHAGYDGHLYNGVAGESVSTMRGSSVLSIHQIAAKGVAGRGVLLDIAALKGVESLAAGEAIQVRDLEAAERRQRVRVGPGDILLVRTGWIRRFTVDRSARAFWKGSPGIDASCLEWLQQREVAAIAADNSAVEVSPPDATEVSLPVHAVGIRDMGLTLGEIFVLDELAADCESDGVWEFFLTAPPLKVKGGVGTPITPIALK